MTAAIPNLRDILVRLRYLVAHAPPELQEAMAERARIVAAKIRPLLEAEKAAPKAPSAPPEAPPSGPTQAPIPDIARQLWALSRGNPDIFTAYMRSYPNPQLQQIAENPAQLNALMNQINDTQSIPPVGQADGVNQAPLQSSNIFGVRYDPLKKTMTTRFQNGSVYKYEGVPKVIFDMVYHGDGVAKTTGSNKFGRWWKFKTPSIGAAFHELIKLGGYPFRKIK